MSLSDSTLGYPGGGGGGGGGVTRPGWAVGSSHGTNGIYTVTCGVILSQ